MTVTCRQDVAEDSQALQHVCLLECPYQTGLCDRVGRPTGDIVVPVNYLASARHVETGNQIQTSRLPGSVRTDG